MLSCRRRWAVGEGEGWAGRGCIDRGRLLGLGSLRLPAFSNATLPAGRRTRFPRTTPHHPHQAEDFFAERGISATTLERNRVAQERVAGEGGPSIAIAFPYYRCVGQMVGAVSHAGPSPAVLQCLQS